MWVYDSNILFCEFAHLTHVTTTTRTNRIVASNIDVHSRSLYSSDKRQTNRANKLERDFASYIWVDSTEMGFIHMAIFNGAEFRLQSV